MKLKSTAIQMTYSNTQNLSDQRQVCEGWLIWLVAYSLYILVTVYLVKDATLFALAE